jgi:tetratricopeptide (TPR) repeat protein
MKIRPLVWLLAALLLGGCSRSARHEEMLEAESDPEPAAPAADEKPYRPYDYVLGVDQVIASYREKVEREPKDFASYALLAQLYVRKAREQGDYASYDRAEAAARKAVELNPEHAPGQANLAVALCAQHRFREGLDLARQQQRKDATQIGLLLLIGDAHLELGEYAEAEDAYLALQKKDPFAPVWSRKARLAELKGKPGEALKLMQQAVEEEEPTCVSKESMAWYPFRMGEIHFHMGQLDKAAAQYEEALKLHPRYPMALAFLGRVRAAQGKTDEAIRLYTQAVGINADLSMLAELGDLYARAGKDFLAKLNHDKLVQTAQGKSVYARELSLFYANHDRDLGDALELAQQDLKVRRDIYAHDTLAWALYKNARCDEAAKAATEALKLGTQDAVLLYHAGMIHHRLGNREKARGYLEQALRVNPYFSPAQAEEARRTLKELGTNQPG